ncbi:unnamed protein product, partial [Mesorhabditis spiculigera]
MESKLLLESIANAAKIVIEGDHQQRSYLDRFKKPKYGPRRALGDMIENCQTNSEADERLDVNFSSLTRTRISSFVNRYDRIQISENKQISRAINLRGPNYPRTPTNVANATARL